VGRARRPTRMGRDGLVRCAPSRPLDYSGSAGDLWAINGGRLLELHRKSTKAKLAATPSGLRQCVRSAVLELAQICLLSPRSKLTAAAPANTARLFRGPAIQRHSPRRQRPPRDLRETAGARLGPSAIVRINRRIRLRRIRRGRQRPSVRSEYYRWLDRSASFAHCVFRNSR
jgi:hypothetical protein